MSDVWQSSSTNDSNNKGGVIYHPLDDSIMLLRGNKNKNKRKTMNMHMYHHFDRQGTRNTLLSQDDCLFVDVEFDDQVFDNDDDPYMPLTGFASPSHTIRRHTLKMMKQQNNQKNINVNVNVNVNETKTEINAAFMARSKKRMFDKLHSIDKKKGVFCVPEIEFNRMKILNDGNPIGKGKFGTIYHGKWELIDVAIKILHKNKNELNSNEMNSFKKEASIMYSIGNHKNIARIFGISIDHSYKMCIITEYYHLKSIEDYIIYCKTNDINITLLQKLKMSMDAAIGVYHLHQCGVIHRDLSARNILLNNNLTAVIADLGMSIYIDSDYLHNHHHHHHRQRREEEYLTNNEFGPIKWMSPESIIQQIFNEQTDTYSFGITLSEIFTEHRPYPDLTAKQVGTQVVYAGIRPTLTYHKYILPNTLITLIKQCWHTLPEKRPYFDHIVDTLQNIINHTNDNDNDNHSQ